MNQFDNFKNFEAFEFNFNNDDFDDCYDIYENNLPNDMLDDCDNILNMHSILSNAENVTIEEIETLSINCFKDEKIENLIDKHQNDSKFSLSDPNQDVQNTSVDIIKHHSNTSDKEKFSLKAYLSRLLRIKYKRKELIKVNCLLKFRQ